MSAQDTLQGCCPMCGELGNYFATKWWMHDNGERFIAAVCHKCELLHDNLLNSYKEKR